jgi:rRNA-processing protein FCF1
MMAAQFPLDLVEELERVLPSYQLLVPSPVVFELEKVKRRSKGKNRTKASIALKMVKSPPFKVIEVELQQEEMVDDALLRISHVLCTNDRDLRTRARERGINVVYIRQKRYLAVDGYLKT